MHNPTLKHVYLYPQTHHVHCFSVNCGAPSITTNSRVVVVRYNSTLVDSVIEYRCKEGLFPSHVFMATCLENGRWCSNPADHTCIHHRMLLLISKHRNTNFNSESGNSESDSSCIILYGDCTELSDILCLWLHLWL